MDVFLIIASDTTDRNLKKIIHVVIVKPEFFTELFLSKTMIIKIKTLVSMSKVDFCDVILSWWDRGNSS